jgi:hypothetical protein
MEGIYEPNDHFPFSQIQFISPTSIAGGNYFIRCLNGKQQPVYIQPPKCSSKGGIVKTGQRMYIDLVFKHDNEAFIEWVEKLETLCQEKIFEKRDKWFESGLEMHDIENSFTPSMKIYKSGKKYIMRATIPIRFGKCGLKIYDEQENDVDIDSIHDKDIMTILEVQGIKCSSRNFQIDFEVKQMMTLNPTDLFETCVFSKKPNPSIFDKVSVEEAKESFHENHVSEHVDKTNTLSVENDQDHQNPLEEVLEVQESAPLEEIEEVDLSSTPLETTSDSPETSCAVDAIDFPFDKTSTEIVQLKKRDDVYYEMYQNAKKKAKIARDIAIHAYLEAKQIKNTYLLKDDLEEDDSEDEKSLYELGSNKIL